MKCLLTFLSILIARSTSLPYYFLPTGYGITDEGIVLLKIMTILVYINYFLIYFKILPEKKEMKNTSKLLIILISNIVILLITRLINQKFGTLC